jgi:hypothetical protein
MSRLRRFDYLLSMLPGLDTWNAPVPVSKQVLLERVADAHGPVQTVQLLLLMDDLLQREALLAQEMEPDQADLAVLDLGQDGSAPVLPAALLPEGGDAQENARVAVDELWSRFFVHAAKVGHRRGSRFVQAWVAFEVGLRNALAGARAQALELDPLSYVVTPEVEDRANDFTGVLSAWSTAMNPHAGLEVLHKARWDWLEEHGKWYSFNADEIEAYAAKLILLHRWRRLTAA